MTDHLVETFTLIENKAPFRVSDLKQWVYCPRILYYALCLPDVRPTTYKMDAGAEAGKEETARERRRGLRAYGLEKEIPLTQSRREFDVPVISTRLGLRGKVDLVIWVDRDPVGEVIPVDYKLSETAGEHFKLQVAAYGLLLEEMSGYAARRGYIYSLPRKQAEEVKLERALREKTARALDAMHHMLWQEMMPEPTPQRGRCVNCEFRRFCNDV